MIKKYPQSVFASWFVVASFLLTGCHATKRDIISASAKAALSTRDSGTREMAQMLDSISNSLAPDELIFNNVPHAAMLRGELQFETDPDRKLFLRLQYATELLHSGETEEALSQFQTYGKQLRQKGASVWQSKKRDLLLFEAQCYLRIAEQNNCCNRNTPDSCLLPIRGSGIHTDKFGSTKAMEILAELLKDDSKDLRSRWLYNIAAMTLGEYPQGVKAAWLIPPKVFQSDYDIKRFPNVASEVGLALYGRSGGCIIDDLDGDGNLDMMISGVGLHDPLRFFHNDGNGTFVERTKEAGLTGEVGGLNLIQADYNNDGFMDVLVLRGGWMGQAGRYPFSLLRNNGDGTFSDVTKQAGLLKYGPTQTAVWLDYNNDGLLDLFVGYESMPDNVHACALFRNNGDGTFTDVAHSAGVDYVGYVKAVVSADYDNDGWPDLYLSTYGGKNVLFHNNGDGTFTDVAAKAGVTEPIYSFSAFFFDYDNDGWPDLFVVGYRAQGVEDIAADYLKLPNSAEYPRLYHNNRNGTFSDVTRKMHLHTALLGMGINFGDLDNDGYLDFYVGTGNPDLSVLVPNRMFHNNEGKFFQDVTTSGDFGNLQKGHAIAFADINNDGQQDVFEQLGGAYTGDTAYSALYANPGHDNHWVTLKLQGVRTNRCAIGARIDVTVRTASGVRDIYRTVGSGGSFGANPLRQEIGLGKAQAIEKVSIYWPVTRTTQVIQRLKMDRFYHIKEDQDHADLMPLKSFPLGKQKPAAQLARGTK